MSALLVVNTTDGMVWTRREGVRDGSALYAPEKCGQCPEFVMATYAELEARGIAGAVDALPMPVVPEPSERERLRADLVTALDNAHQTHPCPVLGDRYWTGCVHYDEAGRVSGVGSCHSGRRADAVLAVRDAEVERLRELLREATAGAAVADDLTAEWRRRAETAAARVTELEAERHVTNEALDDAVQALRTDSGRTVFEDRAASESDPGRRVAWRMLAADVPDGEHFASVHHSYRLGHDLPETGGAS